MSKPLGNTRRCALAVRAHRVLLERFGRSSAAWSNERLVRLDEKLKAVRALMTPAERAYYVEQTGMFAERR